MQLDVIDERLDCLRESRDPRRLAVVVPQVGQKVARVHAVQSLEKQVQGTVREDEEVRFR